MATQAEFINRVLAKLKLRQAGQTAAAEDVAAVTELLPGAFAELAVRGIVVTYPDEVPDEQVEWLAVWVAQHAAEDFGAEMDGDKMMAAEKRLREIVWQEPDYGNPPAGSYL